MSGGLFDSVHVVGFPSGMGELGCMSATANICELIQQVFVGTDDGVDTGDTSVRETGKYPWPHEAGLLGKTEDGQ